MSLQKQQVQNDICTAAESMNLMKNLLSTGLGCITYLRNLFEEDNYDDVPQNGLMLKGIKRGITAEADTLLDWIELGCFDALQKKYLRRITFAVYLDPRNPEVMEETYDFRISYPNSHDGDIAVTVSKDNVEVLNARTKKEIRKATQQMMRTLITLTQTLKPLPDHRLLTMRLYYYEDVTPSDYEPPLFKSADDVNVSMSGEPVKINVGHVETPHHVLTVKIQTYLTNFEDEEQTAVSMTNPVGMTNPVSIVSTNPVSIADPVSINNPAVSKDVGNPNKDVSITSLTPTLAATAIQDKPTTSTEPPKQPRKTSKIKQVLSCICERQTETSFYPEMAVMCTQCGEWQHLMCYGFLTRQQLTKEQEKAFLCRECSDPDAEGDDLLDIARQRLTYYIITQYPTWPGLSTLSNLLHWSTNSNIKKIVDQLVGRKLIVIHEDKSKRTRSFSYSLPSKSTTANGRVSAFFNGQLFPSSVVGQDHDEEEEDNNDMQVDPPRAPTRVISSSFQISSPALHVPTLSASISSASAKPLASTAVSAPPTSTVVSAPISSVVSAPTSSLKPSSLVTASSLLEAATALSRMALPPMSVLRVPSPLPSLSSVTPAEAMNSPILPAVAAPPAVKAPLIKPSFGTAKSAKNGPFTTAAVFETAASVSMVADALPDRVPATQDLSPKHKNEKMETAGEQTVPSFLSNYSISASQDVVDTTAAKRRKVSIVAYPLTSTSA